MIIQFFVLVVCCSLFFFVFSPFFSRFFPFTVVVVAVRRVCYGCVFINFKCPLTLFVLSLFFFVFFFLSFAHSLLVTITTSPETDTLIHNIYKLKYFGRCYRKKSSSECVMRCEVLCVVISFLARLEFIYVCLVLSLKTLSVCVCQSNCVKREQT